MDIISISDSTDVSVARHPSVFQYSYKSSARLEEASSPSVEPESLSSDSRLKCPVTWNKTPKKKLTMKGLINENTPCAKTKVHSWLKQNEVESKSQSVTALEFEKFEGSSIISLKTLTGGRSILIRHDYNKDIISCNPQFSCANANIYCKRFFSTGSKTKDASNLKSPASVNGIHSNVEKGNEVISLDSDVTSEKSIEADSSVCNGDHQNQIIGVHATQGKQKQATISSTDAPLSPESQKKNELCSYLQLMDMNCTDKKIGGATQNRRSIRVKNLNMLSERRKLEKKLLSETKHREKAIVSVSIADKPEAHQDKKEMHEDLGCESFADLKINVSAENAAVKPIQCEEDCKKLGPLSVHSEVTTKAMNLLSINILPKEFLRSSSDFDEAMQNFINVENISIERSSRMNDFIKLRLKKEANREARQKNLAKKLPTFSLTKYRNLRSGKRLNTFRFKKMPLKENYKKKKNSIRKYVQKQHRLKTIKSRSLFKDMNTSKNLDGILLQNSKVANEDDLLKPTIQVTNDGDANTSENMLSKDVDKLAENAVTNTSDSKHEVKGLSTHRNSKEFGQKKHKQQNRTRKLSPKKNLSKSAKTFKEKKFCIIDLSQQRIYPSSDTLIDHDYASKSEIDKDYIMNVIVGQPFPAAVGKNENFDSGSVKGNNVQLIADVTVDRNETFENVVKIFPKDSTDNPLKLKTDKHEHNAVGDEVSKKNNSVVAPIGLKYTALGDELSLTMTNNNCKFYNDKINLVVNNKPPMNIFEDSEYSRPPSATVNLPDMCVKEILNTSGGDSNKNNIPAVISCNKQFRNTRYVPFNSTLEIKSLHKNLVRSKRKLRPRSADTTGACVSYAWDDENSSGPQKKSEKKSYSIKIVKSDGHILNAFYLDFNLVVAQEQVISFWSQSALGNMLSVQNMWISKGTIQRLVSDGNCVFKKSSQTVISLENSIAYVELWIKEHKSDKRERPVADIFANIYFCRHRLNGPDKKVLQLENINGLASDVQYVVLRNSRNIIVSWCETCDDTRKTYIHCYNLASDYQTVVSIREMGNVSHYIESLHNIEDCDTLVMGCGEHKISLWNVEYSYVVATVDISDVRNFPRTLWVKCDRGFLFMLQFYELEKMFKLIAINGINHGWKRLKVFTFPSGYKGLRGVCVDNNILAAFYDNGIICWNIQTGEAVIEEMCSENVYIPSEKHIIILTPNGIIVRHALSHFLTSYDL